MSTHQSMVEPALRGLIATTLQHGGSQDIPVVGLFFEAMSFCCGVMGKQLLRLGHVRQRCYIRIVGFLLQSVAGPSLDAVALAYAAQAVLVLFGALDAVGTLLVAPFLLGERPSWRKIFGAVLVGAGTLAAGALGPRGGEEDRSYGLDELPGLLARLPVAVWAAGFLIVAAWCLLTVLGHASPSGSPRRGLAFGVLAGMCDGNSWFLKTAVRLLAVDRLVVVLKAPLFWLMVLGAASSALASMASLVRGTAEFETIFLVPVLDGARIVSGAAGGFLVMAEGKGLPAGRLAGYWSGVLTVLLGILALFLDEARNRRPGPQQLGNRELSGATSAQMIEAAGTAEVPDEVPDGGRG